MKIALLILGIAAGILIFAGGTASSFAWGMSDNPRDAAAGVNRGCIAAIIGLVIVIGCIVGFFV